MIYITKNDPAVTIEAARSSGAGGQNVNKKSSKAVLKIDINHCNSLTLEQKNILLGNTTIKQTIENHRLLQKLQNNINKDGVLVVSNQESKTLHQNIDRVLNTINQALTYALTIDTARREGLTKAAKTKKKVMITREKVRKYKQQKQRMASSDFDN